MFTPTSGGADSTCTTSLEWVPATSPSLVVDCSFTVQHTCYERDLTLSIKVRKNVYSGKIVEAAGGSLCSGHSGHEAWVWMQKRQRNGTWKYLGPIAEATDGVYSAKLDLSIKGKAWRKGTFRAILKRSDSLDGYYCSAAVSAPVKR